MAAKCVTELVVYAKAYDLAMCVFEISKRFPREETYALTSQIRSSSGSECLNLREAWAKRRYGPPFLSKVTDCDGENSETQSSLDFARVCNYISAEEHTQLHCLAQEVGRMLGAMLKNPSPFLLTADS